MSLPQYDAENQKNEFKSRGYQDEILKKCIERNTIVYLPTGAGKTYIAIMAIKHFASDLQKPISEGGKRTLFLTNTKALAEQQKQVISKLTPLKVAVYTGDQDVDTWKKERWLNEFEENQVITATVQIILDVVRFGYMKISDFNLIIFDECHNGRKEHPMVHLMAKFADCSDENQHPRVIGLSGSLTSSSIKPQNVLQDLRDLEATFRSTITTVQGLNAYEDVLMYSTNATESIVTFEKAIPQRFTQFMIKKIDQILAMINGWPLENEKLTRSEMFDRQPTIQKKLKLICNDFIRHISSLGLYGGFLANLAAIVDLELKKREAETSSLRFLLRALLTAYDENLHILAKKLYDEDEEDDDNDDDDDDDDEKKMDVDTNRIDEAKIAEDPTMILTNSTEQVQKLLIFLTQYVKQNKSAPLKGLIFVEMRYTAKILCHIIRRYMNSYPELNIRVDFMTGNNNRIPDSIETLLAKKCNDRILEKFKRDEINLIICTSVLQEGIDLQECNLVIMYDSPKHYRAFVQTKGRARMKESKFIIMQPAGEIVALQKKIQEWNEVNNILREFLVERAIDRPLPHKDDIDKIFEREFDEKYTTSIGAVVDTFSSVPLINRYCDVLPCDKFTLPSVTWRRIDTNSGKIIVCLLLPIQSPIQYEICGKEMPTLKMAKRSAALEACKELHKIGALNDHLYPVNTFKCLENQKEIYFKIWNSQEFRNDERYLAGTKRNYRTLELQTPDTLRQSMPQLNKKLYLYKINIQPNFKVNGQPDNIVVFHKLLKSNRTYGILTLKPLPRMGLMKFYQSFGELTTVIDHNPTELILENAQQLLALKRFHYTLFRDILEIVKEFFVFDNNDSYIIVPMIEQQIDWNIVREFQTWSPIKETNTSERMAAKYNENDWLYKVICPSYRADHNARYVVTHVLTNKTPLSEFPNTNYESYAAYVTDKYPQIERIVNHQQFLIEVKGITKNLNLLHAGEGEEGRRMKQSRGPEILIPEICHNFNYPGDLWLKAVVLPSALNRLIYLLHAEQLRLTINNYVGLNIENYVPKPLLNNMPKKEKIEERQIQNAIIRPRPEEIEPKELKSTDVCRFHSMNEELGPEIDEPIDVERNFDQLHEIDIDYYCYYITKKFGGMTLNHVNDERFLSLNRYQIAERRGICDVPSDDKVHIYLLDTKLSTPIVRGVEQHNLLAAITTTSAGEVYHMELFEVLGDAFLKFGASLSLMRNHQDWHEGHLTAIKGQIVGNRNLCYNAIKMNLPGMINKNLLQPKDDWQPPMLKIDDYVKDAMRKKNISPNLLYDLRLSQHEWESGKVSKETLDPFLQEFVNNRSQDAHDSSMLSFLGLQRISDKTNSDCVEAILGASLVSIGVERTLKLLEMFNILPIRSGVDITQLINSKFYSPRVHTNIKDHEIDTFLPNYRQLETSIGYKFNDRAYLLQALTHPTYPTNRVTGCYQQLEFLGDAVLDFLITSYIFERCPHMDPGQLTDLRSALVNNVTLACICVRYNIHLYILSQNAALTEFIGQFVDFQVKHKHEVTDHVELLMEETDFDCKMADYVDVPKTLGDVVEALIGAIFLDSGNNLEVTWKVLYRLMYKELDKFMANVPIQLVRKLYEHKSANPEFDAPVVDDELNVTMINLRFTCKGEIFLVHGFGKNKDNAKRAAAKLALLKLRS